MKVLFVCLGNICRSPLAEAIFNHKVEVQGLAKSLGSDSCGTAAYHVGDLPDPRTIQVATDNNVPIRHRGRQFTSKDFDDFDLILTMDQDNLSNVLRLSNGPHQADKVKLLRQYDPDGQGDVPDPYYGNESGFTSVFGMLSRCMDELIAQIKPA